MRKCFGGVALIVIQETASHCSQQCGLEVHLSVIFPRNFFFFFFLHSQKHFFKFSLIYLSLCLIHGGQTRTGAFFFFFYAGIEKCDKCCQGFRSVALFQSWKPLAEKTVEEHYIYSGGICRVQVQEIKQNWDQTEKKSLLNPKERVVLWGPTRNGLGNVPFPFHG